MFYFIICIICSMSYLFILDYHFMYELIMMIFNTKIINDNILILIISIIPTIIIFISYFKIFFNYLKKFMLYLILKKNEYKNDYINFLYIIISLIPILFMRSNIINIKVVLIIYIILTILFYKFRNKYQSVNDIQLKHIIWLIIINFIFALLGINSFFLTYVLLLFFKIKKDKLVEFALIRYVFCNILLLNINNLVINYKLIYIYLICIILTILGSFNSIKWFNNFIKKDNYKNFYLFIIIFCLILLFYFR